MSRRCACLWRLRTTPSSSTAYMARTAQVRGRPALPCDRQQACHSFCLGFQGCQASELPALSFAPKLVQETTSLMSRHLGDSLLGLQASL